jgi:PAS domain S-box-containing protein
VNIRGPLARVRKLKISAKVSATAVVIVVFQGVLSLIGVSILITQTNLASFRGQLSRTTHSVESFIDSTKSDLAVKANLLAGQKKIIDYTDYDLRNLLQQELSIMRLPLKADALYIVNDRLQTVASIGDQRLLASFRVQNLAANWKEGNPLFIAPFSGEIHLWALSPIVRAKNVIGVLAVGLNLDSNFINRIEWINNTAILLSWQMAIFVSGTLPDTFFDEFVKTARAAGAPVNGTVQTSVGRYVLSTSKVPSLQGLFVHCFLDTGASSRLLAQYRIFSLVFLLVVILLGLAISLLLYRYTFVTPFRLLNDAIRSISAGNLGYPIAKMGEDEFGDLARAFEEMTRSLREREKELAELGKYNALVLSNVSSGILAASFDGQITAINPAACTLLGLPPADGGSGHVLPETVPQELARFIDESLHTEPSGSFREIRTEIDGTVRTLSVATSPFLSQQSAKIGIIVVLSDVTHEKELEKKLELSSRMAAMGEMVAGVAHQIRNPLAIMKVSAELLRDHIESSAVGAQPFRLASMIVNEADALGAVVSNFLDFARPYTVRKESCRVVDLLRRVVAMLPLASFPGTELHCDFAEDLPAVPLDRNLLEQVFRNLLINALEASYPGQPVYLGAHRDNGHVVVQVRDSGLGMDEATQKKIFNPFFTTKSDGTGLGLSIVHRIVESHGSRIEVESSPGSGTTFRIHL